MTCKLLSLVTIVLVSSISLISAEKFNEKDIMRKSIVFDKNTPDVFYCPMQKPSTMNKLIVRSKPLHKLCEYEGRPLPPEYKSDCYQDLDESDYACKEKYRIMMRKYPPGSEQPFNGTRLKRFMKLDSEVREKMEKVSNVVDYNGAF